MSIYRKLIREATGCNDEDAVLIEEIMRCDIFHSTLDWQTADELRDAARAALAILHETRELFEDHRQRVRSASARIDRKKQRPGAHKKPPRKGAS